MLADIAESKRISANIQERNPSVLFVSFSFESRIMVTEDDGVGLADVFYLGV